MRNEYGVKYQSTVFPLKVDGEVFIMIYNQLSNESNVILDENIMKKMVEKFLQVVKEELPDEKAHSKRVIMLILNQIEDELDNLPYRL